MTTKSVINNRDGKVKCPKKQNIVLFINFLFVIISLFLTTSLVWAISAFNLSGKIIVGIIILSIFLFLIAIRGLFKEFTGDIPA